MKSARNSLKLIVVFCLFSVFGFSQDVIILKSGDEIPSKVEEVAVDFIKYKKFENLAGPLYSIEKSKVFMIKYQNGSKDVFNEQPVAAAQIVDKPTTIQPQVQQQIPHITEAKTLVARKGDIWYNGVKISESQVRNYMAEAPGAFELFKKGNNQYFWGDFLFTASFLADIGILIQLNKNMSVNPLLQLAAVGSLGSGIALMIVGSNNAKRAVRLYDAKVKNPTSFNLNINANGLGLGLCF